MKKLFLTTVLTMIVATASFHAQVMHWIRPEKTINKDIDLNIRAGAEYFGKVYAQSVANIHVTIIKYKKNQASVVWENDIKDLVLNKMSSGKEQWRQTINIPNVRESKEQIVVNYIVTYKTNEHLLEIRQNKLIEKGVDCNKVVINI